jgi:2-C-methyl-D-erythritol 4-phosphate cytidylyltransferase
VSRVAVVVPAGGSGRRMGGVQKPLILLDGEPLLARSLRPFLERDDVVAIVIALPADLNAEPPSWLTSDGRVTTVAGGARRSDSVRHALAALPHDIDVVLVHDAARPLLTADVVERCIRAAAGGASVIAAIPVTDTIKEVDDDGRILRTPARDRLRAAQTPQAFPAGVLRHAHERAAADGVDATDDAALVAHYGETVHVVEGSARNVKITRPVDLVVARALLAADDDAAAGGGGAAVGDDV